MRKLLLLSILLSGTLLSCDTNKEETPQPIPKEFNINFQYDTPTKEIKDVELILSQEDGTILLDTLLAATQKHALQVKADDENIHATTIIYNAAIDEYLIRTYRNLSAMDNWYVDDYADPVPSITQSEKTKIIYNNVPPYDPGFHFRTRYIGSFQTVWNGSAFTVTYDRFLPTDVAYLLLPNYGKYMLTELTSAQKTVDFSEAADAVKRKFNRPSGSLDYMVFLNGYLSAGNYSKPLVLYWPGNANSDEYDLMYPPTGIAEYELQVRYKGADDSRHTYFYTGTTVPTNVDLVPKADFTVIKTGFDAFSIQFGQDKPTMYSTLWTFNNTGFNARWIVYLSSDETSFAPEAFLINLKSQKLKDKTLSPGKLTNTFSQKAPAYTYQSYMEYQVNPEAKMKKEMKQVRQIGMYFK